MGNRFGLDEIEGRVIWKKDILVSELKLLQNRIRRGDNLKSIEEGYLVRFVY